jgi:hypothetical protein
MKKCGLCRKGNEGLFKAFWVVRREAVGPLGAGRGKIPKTVYGKVCEDCIARFRYTEDFSGPHLIDEAGILFEATCP